MITIIDYGLGNIGSIKNMLKKIGVESIITSNSKEIELAHKIILPGVGSFDDGMQNLANLNLIEILQKKVILEKTPCLGICLGMQLLCKSSEEGVLPGLGWLDAEVTRLPKNVDGVKMRIPHLGWSTITVDSTELLFADIQDPRFYFVHSYCCKAKNQLDKTGTTKFGIEFHSYIQHENIIGVQFHPEKSHGNGKKLLHNFIHTM